ncbi:MAG: GTPase [Deltaproteobacteria bacterium]|nr:GTPase [Deltaproteobacteria bacterium]
MARERVLILGAAGRDFHNFHRFFRDNEAYEVMGFTATQIPGIEQRRYPKELSGRHYPDGIPIFPESQLEQLVRNLRVDSVVFAYSDVSHENVMHLASRAMAGGADFWLLGHNRTMLDTKVPVVAVCAVRTGCGKSQTSRYVAAQLRKAGLRVVAIRHPMPYGDLNRQKVERLATFDDLDKFECTIEEREEYESHLAMGTVVYAGVVYSEILTEAEREADVIIWDGGNNDTSFVRPDLWITVADPLRPGHELRYHPGETNLRAADVVLLNKANTAPKADVDALAATVRQVNPHAAVILGASIVTVSDPKSVKGKRVLLVEDGPTLTHGEMSFGAGKVAAERYGAKEMVDPRSYAVGSIKQTFQKYPNLVNLLPAVGYYPAQIRDLEATINAVPCDVVLAATPIDLSRIIKVNKPIVRVTYELEDMGAPTLMEILNNFIEKVVRSG